MTPSGLGLADGFIDQGYNWRIAGDTVGFDEAALRVGLQDLAKPCFVVQGDQGLGISNQRLSRRDQTNSNEQARPVAYAPIFAAEHLGDPAFQKAHGTTYSYYTGGLTAGC